ncbi:hypothetical protein LTR37_011549, partial [Vermiconidia calcicola]
MPQPPRTGSIELQSLHGIGSDPDSVRGSLDSDLSQPQQCDVAIYDDVPADLVGTLTPDGTRLEEYSRYRVVDSSASPNVALAQLQDRLK